MAWILALHIISMVAWFAGLFYLPRLFVYHTGSHDHISNERFKVMEKKLFYIIMTPAGLLTTIFGLWLLFLNPTLLALTWMQCKLVLVILLWIYHAYCGQLLNRFKHDCNRLPEKFFRVFNEVPTVLLITIVILAEVRP